jgi:hypothetical protein
MEQVATPLGVPDIDSKYPKLDPTDNCLTGQSAPPCHDLALWKAVI